MSEFIGKLGVSEWNSNLSPDQLMRVGEMRKWVEAEEGLDGRSDDDFLLMFLRSCEFDLELTQKTLRMYYQNRIKYPEWCSDRDLNHPDIKPLLQTNFALALMDKNSTNSTVLICNLFRLSELSDQMDKTNKIYSVILEVVARRRNCQLNGCKVIFNLDKCPLWLSFKLLSVSTLKAITQSLVFGVPVRTVALAMVSAPTVAGTLFRICQPFIPSSFRNKVFFVSDWSKVDKIVPLDSLPEEYGGSAGSLKSHEDAFLMEMLSLNEHLVDDNKYGYKKNPK